MRAGCERVRTFLSFFYVPKIENFLLFDIIWIFSESLYPLSLVSDGLSNLFDFLPIFSLKQNPPSTGTFLIAATHVDLGLGGIRGWKRNMTPEYIGF